MPIINLHQCVNIYGRTLPISEDQICAGGELGQDACTGFGGAPLLVRHGDTFYQVSLKSKLKSGKFQDKVFKFVSFTQRNTFRLAYFHLDRINVGLLVYQVFIRI